MKLNAHHRMLTLEHHPPPTYSEKRGCGHEMEHKHDVGLNFPGAMHVGNTFALNLLLLLRTDIGKFLTKTIYYNKRFHG